VRYFYYKANIDNSTYILQIHAACNVDQSYSTWGTATPGVREDMLGVRKIKKE
jgi:hypothetical protein